MRPGREARVLRRLVARHTGPFPKPVVTRIWREIISVFTRLQGPFAAAAYAPQQRPDLGSLARDHFGSLTPITRFESEMGVLRAVSRSEEHTSELQSLMRHSSAVFCLKKKKEYADRFKD